MGRIFHAAQMSLKDLTAGERKTVFECLAAASDGPFFPDWEFHTLFGLERIRVRQIAERAPNIDDSLEEVAQAINGSMANLLGYPHHQSSAWSKFISVPAEEVSRVWKKWRTER